MSPLDLSGKGHVDKAVAVRLFSRVRPPGKKISLFNNTAYCEIIQYYCIISYWHRLC